MGLAFIFEYLPVISAIFTLSLALFVLWKNPRKKLHQLFFLICLTFITWFIGTFMMMRSALEIEIIWWDRFVYGGVVFVPILMYHFGLVFIKQDQNPLKKYLIHLGYLLSFLFLIISRTNLFINDLYYYQWGVHSQAQIFHHLFLLYFAIYLLVFLKEIIVYYWSLPRSIKKIQTGYVVFAFLFMILIGSTAYLPAYNIAVLPIAYLTGVVFSIIVAFAIVRYRFLGINFVIRKSTILFVTALIVLSVYNLLFKYRDLLTNSLHLSWQIVSLVAVISLAISFQSLKTIIQRLFDKLLFTDAEKYEQTRQRLVSGHFDKIELPEIIDSLVKEFNHLYKFKGLDILLKDWQTNDYSFVYSTIAKKSCQLEMLSRLANYFHDKDVLVLTEQKFLSERQPYQYIYDIMQQHNYDLAVPIKDNQQILGIVFAQQPCKVLKVEDYHLLKQVTQKVSLALASVILYQQTLQSIKARGLAGK
ncbi:MAG: hypothetical protein CO073_02375 [Candidatus Komeilibacteria bacterium CG_4_9_14_0_8_um_filter_36_9]|uniref:Histidine kinase N-terminal 7TM region domain-containing protein n=2 Tax=Candidatus Komeiliibacteriota TaxID=1817908 RepID=A0A2M8DR78_9BACT|nr:MAG: hypothetical protein COY67_00670 [Candidatus Komeilibacteria bacterium CG_4_10_14_0_8_um_filter_37_78]PJC01893.1 MAG: hypothetical protein CO073_02375 [Candidatus Komeilibacteria bacterium CG_4_9_14_0_8_um_filter_36_9]